MIDDPREQLDADGRRGIAVHYAYRDGGRERVACMPDASSLSNPERPVVQRSDDPRAVTCFACRKTNVFRQHAALLGMQS